MMLIMGCILWGSLPSMVIPTNSQCQSDVSGHHSNSFCMKSQQVNILEKAHYEFLAASWRASITLDWNLTCIEGVPGPWGHIWYSWEISWISL